MEAVRVQDRARLNPRFTPLQLLAHIGAWIPLFVLLWDASHHQLTANPILEATHRTGTTALVLLVFSLACTPLNVLFGFRQAIKLRRPLGVYGLMYIGVHLFIFAVLDYGLDLDMIRDTVVEQRFVLVGLASFLMLLPLGVTSTRGWMKRLGKRWIKLHRLVYLAVPLAVVHYVWLVKADIRVPLQYGAVVAILLFLRIPRVRHFFSSLRYRLAPRFDSNLARPSKV
ncbi:MAG: sulfoxide reductase heme-binding subunit YedZ [Chloroflexi bacterium]|nr:sulfoxide reductase heme-binding subunit YedZ [Chloroflexota bacterium]